MSTENTGATKLESPSVAASNRFVGVREAAEYLGVSKGMLYKIMENGTLEYLRLGRARRIRMSALEALVERNTVKRGER